MRSLLAVAALILAGCSWSDALIIETKALPAGNSFAYKQGYEAGCKTGIAHNGGIGFDKPGPTSDESRMQSEPDYGKGWNDGANACNNKYAAKDAPWIPPAR
jgi:hypothetical protein